jgi:hypothetical protein
MQDEHFMQGWNDGHSRFSADLDRGIGLLAERLSRKREKPKVIRNPYGIPAEVGPGLPPAARASLRGVAASVLTVTLWMVVLALATPAPGLAASSLASAQACACLAHPPLA